MINLNFSGSVIDNNFTGSEPMGIWDILNNLWFLIKDHKDLIYTFAVLLIAIFIPLVIYFFQEINKDDKNFKELDLTLFKKELFNVKHLIWLFAILFVLLLFWNEGNNWYYFPNLTIIFCSVFIFWRLWVLITKTANFDRFLKSKNFDNEEIKKERLNFLKKLEFNKDNFFIWEDTLKSNFKNDTNFFAEIIEILLEKIGNFADKNNTKDDLNYFAENLIWRIFSVYSSLESDVSIDSFLNKWNFKTFLELHKKIYDYRKDKNLYYLFFETIIKSRLELFDRKQWLWLFYKDLKVHFKKYQDKDYQKSFLTNLLTVFWESEKILLDSNYTYDIVNNFPWKIKKENIKSDNKQKVVFDYITDKIKHEISFLNYLKKEVSLNKRLDNFVEYLFDKNFSIPTLTDIFYLLFVPIYNNDRVWSILGSKKSFWFVERSVGSSVCLNEINKLYENEINKRYKYTIDFFKEVFDNNRKNDFKNLLVEFTKIDKSKFSEEQKRKIERSAKILNDLTDGK